MNRIVKTVTALGAATALTVPVALLSATTAHADGPQRDREFRVAGAEVDFSVEKDDRRFEVEVEIDDVKPRSAWRVTLVHDGKVFHNRVHRADSDGDIEIDKKRRDTAGKDTFRVVVTKVGGPSRAAKVVLR